MAKMAELHAQGITDLYSYEQGVANERERIVLHLISKLCTTAKVDVACSHALCFQRQTLISWIETGLED